MTDEDFQEMTAFEQGYFLNHPFTDTCLMDLTRGKHEPIVDEEEEDDSDDSLFDVSEIAEMVSNDSFGQI